MDKKRMDSRWERGRKVTTEKLVKEEENRSSGMHTVGGRECECIEKERRRRKRKKKTWRHEVKWKV